MRTKKLGILLGEKSNPFWTEMERHYRVLGLEKGFRIECHWPSEEMDEEAQLRKLEEMIRSDFDLIVINPLSDQNLIPGILHAVQKGIPIIDVGEKTNQEKIKEAGPLYLSLKTVDFYQQGVLGAQYIIDRLRPFEKSDVVIMEGRKNAVQSIKRSQGAADTFQRYNFISVIKKGHADFERSLAKTLAKKWLQEAPSIKAFFCANDVMALGVTDTLRSIGRVGEVIVVGIDLIPEAVSAIKEGILNASVAFSTNKVVQVVLEAAKKVLRGEAIPNTFQVESALVDKRNVKEFTLLKDI